MNELSDILTVSTKDGLNLLTIDTTRSNLMGSETHPSLREQVSDWDSYRPFADKYGLVLTMLTEDFVSIFVLSQLLQDFKLICHPTEQDENSSLNRSNFKTTAVNWILKTSIYYDREYNYTVEFEEFRDNGHFPLFMWSEAEGMLEGSFLKRMWNRVKFLYKQSISYVPESKMYFLQNSRHVHQAVECGGFTDVYNCPNFIGYETEEQLEGIIRHLTKKKKPNLQEILEFANFYAVDFKGIDAGYARHLKIYSKSDLSEVVTKLENNFKPFVDEFRVINLESENLDQFESKMNRLLVKYGR